MKENKTIENIQYFTISSDDYLVLLHRDMHTMEIVDVETLETKWLWKSEEKICSQCYKLNQSLYYTVKYQEEETTIYETRILDLNDLQVRHRINGTIIRMNSTGQFLINDFEENININACYSGDDLKMLWKMPHWEFGPTIFDQYFCWANQSKTEFGLVDLFSGTILWKTNLSSLSVLHEKDTVLYVNWKKSRDFVFVPLESGGLLQIETHTGEFIRHIATSTETGRFGSHEIDAERKIIYKVLTHSILEINFDNQESINHEYKGITPDYFHHAVGSPVSQTDQYLFIYNSGKNKIFQVQKIDMSLEDTIQILPGKANEGRKVYITLLSYQNKLFSLDSSFTLGIHETQ